MHTLYKNATGIRVLYALGKDERADRQEGLRRRAQPSSSKDNTAFSQAGGEEFLAFHLITETMLQKGGEDWATWFPTIRDKIIAVQNSRRQLDRPPLHHQPHLLHRRRDPGADLPEPVFADFAGLAALVRRFRLFSHVTKDYPEA